MRFLSVMLKRCPIWLHKSARNLLYIGRPSSDGVRWRRGAYSNSGSVKLNQYYPNQVLCYYDGDAGRGFSPKGSGGPTHTFRHRYLPTDTCKSARQVCVYKTHPYWQACITERFFSDTDKETGVEIKPLRLDVSSSTHSSTTYHSLRIQLVKNAPDDGPMRSETCRANISAA